MGNTVLSLAIDRAVACTINNNNTSTTAYNSNIINSNINNINNNSYNNTNTNSNNNNVNNNTTTANELELQLELHYLRPPSIINLITLYRIIHLLILYKVDIATINTDAKTPLMLACQNGLLSIVKLLLFKRMPISSLEYSLNDIARYEAKPWMKDNDGHTAIMLALIHKQYHIVKYLITCRLASVSDINSIGENIFHLIARYGIPNEIILLFSDLEQKLWSEYITNCRHTNFLETMSQRPKMLILLNIYGKRPIDIAVEYGHKEVALVLYQTAIKIYGSHDKNNFMKPKNFDILFAKNIARFPMNNNNINNNTATVNNLNITAKTTAFNHNNNIEHDNVYPEVIDVDTNTTNNATTTNANTSNEKFIDSSLETSVITPPPTITSTVTTAGTTNTSTNKATATETILRQIIKSAMIIPSSLHSVWNYNTTNSNAANRDIMNDYIDKSELNINSDNDSNNDTTNLTSTNNNNTNNNNSNNNNNNNNTTANKNTTTIIDEYSLTFDERNMIDKLNYDSALSYNDMHNLTYLGLHEPPAAYRQTELVSKNGVFTAIVNKEDNANTIDLTTNIQNNFVRPSSSGSKVVSNEVVDFETNTNINTANYDKSSSQTKYNTITHNNNVNINTSSSNYKLDDDKNVGEEKN